MSRVSPVKYRYLQWVILESSARFKVIACGRRFGKTEMGKLLLLAALANPKDEAWWIAPTKAMAAEVWRDLCVTVGESDAKISQTERRIEFPKRGRIAVRSAHNPERLRGAGLSYVVLDEAAFLPANLWPEVVRPMLVERKGGAAFLSTPFGHNHFYDLFRLGQDPNEPDWQSWQLSSYANPNIEASELDALRRTTPDLVFRAEYMAEFTDSAAQVFNDLSAVATAAPDAEPQPGRRYVMGVDWGRSVDFTACAVLDATTMHMVALDRFNGLSWSAARARVAELARRWSVAAVWAESNAVGTANIEALQAEGVPVRPFLTTNASKQSIIDALAVAIERAEIALLPDPVLLGELTSYRLDRLPGGGYRYSAPPGAHDDTVIALALAFHAARQPTLTLDFA